MSKTSQTVKLDTQSIKKIEREIQEKAASVEKATGKRPDQISSGYFMSIPKVRALTTIVNTASDLCKAFLDRVPRKDESAEEFFESVTEYVNGLSASLAALYAIVEKEWADVAAKASPTDARDDSD